MEIALKIDVDTHQGLGEGVPRLARMLENEGIAATFFISMGPDNSGRAITRVIRNRGFLKKMFRTNAVSMYGSRTILSGTLLPARAIALAYPNVIRDLNSAGFETAVHGYDHVKWQDQIDAMGEAGVRQEIGDAFEAFRAIAGEPARSFAAPGWRTSAAAMRALDERGLIYRSDTRGRAPYRCAFDGAVIGTMEIPTTLPTLDEVMGSPEARDANMAIQFYLSQFRADALNVHTIHAETEGMAQLVMFTELVRKLEERGARFLPMREIAARINCAELPVCEVIRTTIEGRAGWISAQGTELGAPPVAAGVCN